MDQVMDAHLAERSGPLQRQQEAPPGAGRGVPPGAAIFVVPLKEVLGVDAASRRQQEQERRTEADQQGQHPHGNRPIREEESF